MKLLNAKDRVSRVELENIRLKKELAQVKSDLAYIAMMAGIDLTQKEITEYEQTEQASDTK